MLRTKNHTRIMPFLLPPPDFTSLELNQKRITGTMEAQICRSASPWSIGTPKRIEHSIQNAYIKAIQLSDHFVYIEVCFLSILYKALCLILFEQNQFFVTSSEQAVF